MPRQPRSRPHRFATPLLSVLSILAIVLAIIVIEPHPTLAPRGAALVVDAGAEAASPSPAPATSAPAPTPAASPAASASPGPPLPPGAAGSGWTPPALALLSTDPLHAPHRIADALSRDIEAVPAGGFIKVETYYLDSSVTAPALRAAYRRGVHVQIIVTGWHRQDYPPEAALARLLGTDRRAGSWLHWASGSSRGGRGSTVDHDKVWRFSQIGRRRWVTVVGSYNNGNDADAHAYALAISVADRRIYDRFDQLWVQSKADRAVRRTTRSFRGRAWDAYWLPGERLAPGADPAVRRLRSIPARPSTVMHIRMYSMFGIRGTYVTTQLVRMARQGAHISLIAGPTVDWSLQQRLRAAGVDVQGGCWRDGTFDHAKDMSASWLSGGRRVFWTWVGSDNWNDDNYLKADQVELGLAGRGLYRNFDRIFATIARRPDVVPWRCRPS